MPYPLKYMSIQARCLQCGKDLSPGGRPDRKFCCRECKNQYHNHHRRRFPLREELEGAVLRALDTNHAILDRLYRMGVRTIDLATLSQLGFDARFVTSYLHLGRHNIFTLFDLQFEMTPSQLKRLTCLSMEEDAK
jgi:hypothetical protein